MLQILCLLTILISTTVASAASIVLKNGDVIIGEIKQEKVRFQAKVGKVEPSTEEIIAFENGKLHLRDGTIIVGSFTEGSLDISTSWGGVISVKTQDISKITQEAPIKPNAGVKPGTPDEPKSVSHPYIPPPPRGPSGAPVLDTAGNVIAVAPPPYSPHRPSPGPLKKTIAVATFENRASLASGAVGFITRGLADQLTDALVQSGRFKVLDRQIIESVIAEQDFGASGRTTMEGGAKVGGIYRAQILVKGTVTEFDPGTAASGQAFNLYGFSLGSTRAEAHVAVIVYLVDTTTSQVIDSQRIEGKAESGGVVWGMQGQQFGFGQAGFQKTPLGKATQIVIDRAVEYIAQRLAREPWQGRVAKVDGKTVFINAGSRSGVMKAQEFIACKGAGIVDPETGVSLGHTLKPIGLIRVTNVYPDFAEAQLVDGSIPVVGDFIVERRVTGLSPYQ